MKASQARAMAPMVNTDASIQGCLETAVQELAQRFAAEPDQQQQPITNAACPLAVREMLTALEALLAQGLDPSAATQEAVAEPLWWALKQLRSQESSTQKPAVEAAMEAAASAVLPGFCLEYGWGRARLLLIECLNRQCLAVLVEALVLDAGLRKRLYPNPEAPMRRAETCAWLQAQASALQGISFALRHWRSLLPTTPSEAYTSPDRRPSSLSFPFSVFSPSPERASLTPGRRRRRSRSFGLGFGEAEEADEQEEAAEEEAAAVAAVVVADRRLHEGLRLQYGVESAVGYLLQSYPLERVTVPAGEQHRRAVVAAQDSRPGSRSHSPMPLGGREEEKGEMGRGAAAGSSTRRYVAVWQWEVAYFDIAFQASLVHGGRGDETKEDVATWGRHPASAGVVEGSAVLPPPVPAGSDASAGVVEGSAVPPLPVPAGSDGGSSKLVMTWDNSYSLRRAKNVSMRMAVVPLEAFEAASMTAREAMVAAVWAALTREEEDEDGFRMPCSSPRKPMALSSPRSLEGGGQIEAFPLSPAKSPYSARARPRSGSTASVDSAVSLRERDRGFWSYLQSMINGGESPGLSSRSQEEADEEAPQPPLLAQLQRSSSLSASATKTAMHCQMCGEGFGLFCRPHRCRRCQGAFCLPCSRHYVILPGAAEVLGRPQRVCDRCYVLTKDHDMLKRQGSSDIDRGSSWASSTLSLSSAASSRASSPFAFPAPPPAVQAPPSKPQTPAESKGESDATGAAAASDGGGAVNSEYEALKLRPELQRFFKMLDVGVPAIAVTHKMAAEGIDDGWVKVFVAGSNANKQDGASPGAGKAGGKPPLPLLRRASGASSSSSPNKTTASPSLLKLRPVHFERLAPGRAEKSVFLRRRSSAAHTTALPLPPTPTTDPSAGPSAPLSSSPGKTAASPLVAVAGRGGVQGQTVKELAELFSLTPRARPAAAGGIGGVGGRRGPVFGAALDSRRLQNVGIVYTYFKKSFPSTDDLLRTILTLDRERIPAERLPGLLDILPSVEETEKLLTAAGYSLTQSLHHDPHPTPSKVPTVPLHEVEAFMLHTLSVPRLPAKVRALHFVLGWQEGARSLASRMETLQRAFADVMKSERLVRLLEMLLYLGNTLNAYSGSGAACVVEAFTLDSLVRVALTKSTTAGSDVTLLDYLVRLAAEHGEGSILDVGQDMPTLRLAGALPDSSAVLREARVWVRDFGKLKEEARQEAADLNGYEEARIKQLEAKREAAEERLRAVHAAQEAAKQRAEEEKRRAAAHAETLRALAERLAMEREDGPTFQGEHFLRFLDEAEAEHAEPCPAFWARLLAVLRGAGPPMPDALRAVLREDEVGQEEEVKRLHHELGGKRGDCPEQQRLLTAASRYLGARIRLARAAEALKAKKDGEEEEAAAPAIAAAVPTRPPPPPFLGGIGGAGGGRAALLAALRGRGGRLGGRGIGRDGGMRRTPASPSSIEEGEDQEQQDGKLKVQYEAERAAFAAGLAGFAAAVEARVEAVAAQAQALDGASRELFEYWGEDVMTASSSRLLNTLSRFLASLGAAKQRYERRHGPILTPDILLEEEEAESAQQHASRSSRRRRRSSLPPLAVGQRVVTVFGPGVVEAVRVRDRTHVVRFFFGSGLGVGYLKGDALVGPGARVATPFGKGVVEEVERGSGVHRVRLDWGALAALQPTAVRAGALDGGGEEGKSKRKGKRGLVVVVKEEQAPSKQPQPQPQALPPRPPPPQQREGQQQGGTSRRGRGGGNRGRGGRGGGRRRGGKR